MRNMKMVMLGMTMICTMLSIDIVYAQPSTTVTANPGTTITANEDSLPGNKKDEKTTANNTFTKLDNPLKVDKIEDVIYLAIDIAIYVGVAFSILAIIFIGFKFVFAQGKPEAIKEAQMWFFYVIIGLAILISSKVIVEIVKNTFISAGVVNEDVFRTK